MDHLCSASNHPPDPGKIERWHQILKNRILPENYYLPGDLEAAVGTFFGHYNHRDHESPRNLTPADIYSGHGHTIIYRRRKIKKPDNPKGPPDPPKASGLTAARMTQSLRQITLAIVSFILKTDTRPVSGA